MDQEQIRNIVITSIFSNDVLLNKLTLKGGHALELQGVNVRASQDIDLAISHNIKFTKEENEPLFRESLTTGFAEVGYQVVNFTFNVRPRHKNKIIEDYEHQSKLQDVVWGGYHIRFGIMPQKRYITLKNDHVENIGAHADTTWGNKKNIEIDLSKDEYTEPREETDLEGYTIYLYTPIMIVYEKIRASCQQLPQYKIGSTKERARDLFDIYELLIHNDDLHDQMLSPDNIYILKEMFKLKDVDFSLLLQINSYKKELFNDYQNNVLPQIRNEKDKQDFKFIFNFAEHLFKQIYNLVSR